MQTCRFCVILFLTMGFVCPTLINPPASGFFYG
nr:MAG TPA: hypothetical protein [Caudoviricetes sp.]